MRIEGSQPFSVLLANFRARWQPGWAGSRAFKLKGDRWYFLQNSSAGVARVHSIGMRPLRGKVWEDTSWDRVWGRPSFFSIRGEAFSLHHASDALARSGSNLRTIKWTTVGSGGSIKLEQTVVSDLRRPVAFDATATTVLGETASLIGVTNTAVGATASVLAIETDGTIGRVLQRLQLDQPATDIRIFRVGTDSRVLFLDPASGRAVVYVLRDRSRDSGVVDLGGTRASHLDYVGPNDLVEVLSWGGKSHLLRVRAEGLDSSGNNVDVRQLDESGNIGRTVAAFSIDPTWTEVASAQSSFPRGIDLLLLDGLTGKGHHHVLSEDLGDLIRADPDEPRTVEYYERMFTDYDAGLVNTYWSDLSARRINLNGSVVKGWFRVDATWQEMKDLTRGKKIERTAELIAAQGYQVPAKHRVVVIHSSPPDSGADDTTFFGANSVLGHPFGEPRDCASFLAHEMGHSFGFKHSQRQEDAGRSAPIEYGDDSDIMGGWSWSTPSLAEDDGLPKGPGMSLGQLIDAGWVRDGEYEQLKPVAGERFRVLRSLSLRPERLTSGPYGLVVESSSGEVFSVTYRTPDRWDIGAPASEHNKVRINRHFYDGHGGFRWSSLISGHGKAPQEFLYDDTDGVFSISVTDRTNATATVRVADGPANVRLHKADPLVGLVGENKRYAWTDGWTTAEVYRAGGRSHLLLLKEEGFGSDGKNVHIHSMPDETGVGPRALSYRWTEGWSTAKFFEVDGEPFMFIMKSTGFASDGSNAKIHRIDSDGSIGPQTWQTTLETGWTHADIAETGSARYLFVYRQRDEVRGANLRTYIIDDDAEVSGPIAESRVGRWEQFTLIRTSEIFTEGFYPWITVRYEPRIIVFFAEPRSGGELVETRVVAEDGAVGPPLPSDPLSIEDIGAIAVFPPGRTTQAILVCSKRDVGGGTSSHVVEVSADGSVRPAGVWQPVFGGSVAVVGSADDGGIVALTIE